MLLGCGTQERVNANASAAINSIPENKIPHLLYTFRMRDSKIAILAFLAVGLGPCLATATQYTGSVRAADEFVPGATVTATQGNSKQVAYTDDWGRYTLDLAPGSWDIQVDMFGFTPVHEQVTIGDHAISKDWTLEMPRIGEAPTAAGKSQSNGSVIAPNSQRARSRPYGGRPNSNRPGAPGPNGSGTSGQPPRPGFQNAQVRSAGNSGDALAQAAQEASAPDLAAANVSGEADESLLVNGSTSGGLAQSSDDENRRRDEWSIEVVHPVADLADRARASGCRRV